MDTTPEFISMVKAANLPWEWRVGDWAWDDIEKQTGIVIMHGQTIKVAWDNTAVMAFNPDANIIPLPRLDQLAEMHGIEAWSVHRDPPVRGEAGIFWCNDGAMHDTPEKAMLSRYMCVFHNKSWNGKEWA